LDKTRDQQQQQQQQQLLQPPLVLGGFRAEEAVELLKEFYAGENPNAPEDKRKPKRK